MRKMGSKMRSEIGREGSANLESSFDESTHLWKEELAYACDVDARIQAKVHHPFCEVEALRRL